jgi:ABC-type uncharacterized transport system auxiliary subunit
MNTRLNAAGSVRRLGAAALCAALGLLAGCLGPREIMGPRTFVVRPELSVPKAGAKLTATLGVRDLSAPLQYDRRMVILEPDFRLGSRSNEMWAEPPAAALTRCITDALVAGGHFADVGNAFDMARPDTVLTGEVRAFHENRTVKPHVAEVELRLELREARSPKVLWAGTLHETEPLDGTEGGSLAVAMNAAVARASARIAEALSSIEYVPEDPNAFLEKGKGQSGDWRSQEKK